MRLHKLQYESSEFQKIKYDAEKNIPGIVNFAVEYGISSKYSIGDILLLLEYDDEFECYTEDYYFVQIEYIRELSFAPQSYTIFQLKHFILYECYYSYKFINSDLIKTEDEILYALMNLIAKNITSSDFEFDSLVIKYCKENNKGSEIIKELENQKIKCDPGYIIPIQRVIDDCKS